MSIRAKLIKKTLAELWLDSSEEIVNKISNRLLTFKLGEITEEIIESIYYQIKGGN